MGPEYSHKRLGETTGPATPYRRGRRRVFTKLYLAEKRAKRAPSRLRRWRFGHAIAGEFTMSEQLSIDRPAPWRAAVAPSPFFSAAAPSRAAWSAPSRPNRSAKDLAPWHMTVMGPGMGPFAGPLTPEQIVARRPRGAPSRDRARRQRRPAGQARGDRQRHGQRPVPMRAKVFAARQQARDLLTQTTTDRAARKPRAPSSSPPWTASAKDRPGDRRRRRGADPRPAPQAR